MNNVDRYFMIRIINFSRSSFVISLIICLCFILIQCIDNGYKNKEETEPANNKFLQFAGSASCATCHKKIYDSFIYTGHFSTSQPGNEKNIKGSFEKVRNVFHYNPNLFVSMEKRDSGLYQVEYRNGIETRAQRIDITIGSGIRGQSYLSWQNNFLFQLPVSYLSSANSWANSPGDLNNEVFNRTINSRCLECHTTYANVISSPLLNRQEEFDHHQILYGIGCEKCHGPGARHVTYQTENPKATEAKYIINPGTFSRQQTLDLCGLCHGGKLGNIKPAFSFASGDKLNDYFIIDNFSNNPGIDVHGNQYGLLAKSKCYRTSSTMTCITCHSPHDNERGNVGLFSQRCMACHNKEHGTFCKINSDKVTDISSNCIDCHMPKRDSRSIVLKLDNNKLPTTELLRTHFISIYPDATRKFLSINSRGAL